MGCAAVCFRHRRGQSKQRRRSCLACCLRRPGAARSDYRLDFALPLLDRCFCCARTAPSLHTPWRSEAEREALRDALCSRNLLVPRQDGQGRPNQSPPIGFHLVNRACYLPLIRSHNQAKQIVKSERSAALKIAEESTYSY